MTPAPTSTPVPTGPITDNGDGSGPGFSFGGFLGLALHWWGLFASIGDAVVGWVATGITDIIHGVADLVTAEPRPDQWGELAGFLSFLQQVALGWAGAFFVFGLMLYVRGLVSGTVGSGLIAAAMLTRSVETAILVPAALWIVGQVLDLGQAASDLITGHSGASGVAQFARIVAVLVNVGSNPVTILAGLVGVVVFLLVVLMKLASAAVLAWLACVGVLSCATWTMGARIVGRWFWNFLAVACWGAGWALWFKIVAAVLSDFSVTAPLSPFLVLALLLMGYGIPRLVDDTLGTSVAGHATGLAGFVVGIGAGISLARGGARRHPVVAPLHALGAVERGGTDGTTDTAGDPAGRGDRARPGLVDAPAAVRAAAVLRGGRAARRDRQGAPCAAGALSRRDAAAGALRRRCLDNGYHGRHRRVGVHHVRDAAPAHASRSRMVKGRWRRWTGGPTT